MRKRTFFPQAVQGKTGRNDNNERRNNESYMLIFPEVLDWEPDPWRSLNGSLESTDQLHGSATGSRLPVVTWRQLHVVVWTATNPLHWHLHHAVIIRWIKLKFISQKLIRMTCFILLSNSTLLKHAIGNFHWKVNLLDRLMATYCKNIKYSMIVSLRLIIIISKLIRMTSPIRNRLEIWAEYNPQFDDAPFVKTVRERAVQAS